MNWYRLASTSAAMLVSTASIALIPGRGMSAQPERPTPDQLRKFVLASLVRDGKPGELAHRKGIERQLRKPWLSALIEHSQPLVHFPPYRSISVRVMDPAAGPPGHLWLDRCVLFRPGRAGLSIASKRWINTYRKAKPLPIAKWSDDQLSDYIEELVRILGRDFSGFKILGLQRESVEHGKKSWPITVNFERPSAPIKHVRGARIVFLPSGGLSLLQIPK